jgi:hypothetical protein
MPVPRRRLAALIAVLALAAPASSAAQSAGDDQYEDPFAGENGGSAPSRQQPAPAAAAPESEPAPQAAAPAAQAAPQPAVSAAAPARTQLPYTGRDAAPALIAGTLLLAGGVALRLRLREPR